jgi:hypothetical protein
LQVLVLLEPRRQCFHAIGIDVEFGTIAGRQDHCLGDAIERRKRREGTVYAVTRKHDLLANFDRRRVMVQPENVQCHDSVRGSG